MVISLVSCRPPKVLCDFFLGNFIFVDGKIVLLLPCPAQNNAIFMTNISTNLIGTYIDLFAIVHAQKILEFESVPLHQKMFSVVANIKVCFL